MDSLREYGMGIAAAALICAITLSFGTQGKMQPLLKLICGLVITFSVLKPVLAFSKGDFEALGILYREDAAAAVEEGKRIGEETLRDVIIQETGTYILDKARQMGLAIEAEVQLAPDGLPVPWAVTIHGDLSPYERKRLSWFLRDELGIQEENQRWT